jgi:hypothetical protein
MGALVLTTPLIADKPQLKGDSRRRGLFFARRVMLRGCCHRMRLELPSKTENADEKIGVGGKKDVCIPEEVAPKR